MMRGIPEDHATLYTCAGTAPTYTLSVMEGRTKPLEYRDGFAVMFQPNATNPSGTPTLNVESLGAVDLKLMNGGVLPINFLNPDFVYTAIYNDTAGDFYLDAAHSMSPQENMGINGDVENWQEAASFTATGWTADNVFADIGGGATIDRQAFTQGQTDVPGEPRYYWRHDRTVADSVDNTFFRMPFGDNGVRTCAGEDVCVTFYGKADSAKTLKAYCVQDFGAGGSPNADVETASQDVDLTTSWQRFSLVFSLASISGLTLGTAGDFVSFKLDEETSYETVTVDIARVKIEKGSVFTGYLPINRWADEERYARYFQKSYDIDTDVGAVAGAGRLTAAILGNASHTGDDDVWGLESALSPRMRAVPAITWYSTSTGTADKVYNASDAADRGVTTTRNPGERHTGMPQLSGTQTAGDIHYAQYTADARYDCT